MKAPKINVDEVFAILERFAVEGKRCPESGCHGIGHAHIPALARAGRIKIEISGHNYRTVTLLTGPHAGKSTAPDPKGGKVWRTIDARGTHLDIRTEPRPSARRQPSSLPRF